MTEVNIMYLLCLVCFFFYVENFFSGPFRSFSGRSRPSDNGTGARGGKTGHLDPDIRQGTGLQKIFVFGP